MLMDDNFGRSIVLKSKMRVRERRVESGAVQGGMDLLDLAEG